MKSLLGERSNPASDSMSSTGNQFSFISTPRMSRLPSVRIPLLRRPDSEEEPHHTKLPLLSMKMSSVSFLDSSITDAVSQLPLYSINTTSTSTTLTRNDRKGDSVTAALIKWPQVLPTKPSPSGKEATDGVLVQMRNSRWDTGDSLLKPAASPNASRKFKIPNYSQSMKWKRYGDKYWCTTTSVKGPVAIMDRAGHSQPTKLIIYETLYDKYDPKSLSAIRGVSILLLDHIIVTALLLVTDLQEWMLVSKLETQNPSLPGSSGQASSSVSDLASTRLRKIVYGEPMFPKISTTGLKSKHSSLSISPMTPALLKTPTSPNFRASVYNEDAHYTSSRPSSPTPGLPSIVGSCDDLNDRELFSSSSPLAESFHFSSRRPSHSHFDPSFYGSTEPPVPPLPLKYAKSLHGLGASPQPSTQLPQSFQKPLPSPIRDRPKVSPPEESFASVGHKPTSPHPQGTGMVRSERSDSVRSYASSSGRRPLPKPPQVPPITPSLLVARRVQSSVQLRSNVASAPSSSSLAPATRPSSRPQRSLPPTPSTSVANDTVSPTATSTSSAATSPLLSPDSLVYAHSRNPPITKASQEDLTNWVHLLTNPQRDLPPAPLPSSSIFDVPPPAYDTINFSRRKPPGSGSSTERARPSS